MHALYIILFEQIRSFTWSMTISGNALLSVHPCLALQWHTTIAKTQTFNDNLIHTISVGKQSESNQIELIIMTAQKCAESKQSAEMCYWWKGLRSAWKNSLCRLSHLVPFLILSQNQTRHSMHLWSVTQAMYSASEYHRPDIMSHTINIWRALLHCLGLLKPEVTFLRNTEFAFCRNA